jgi:dihydroneopterin aldolase
MKNSDKIFLRNLELDAVLGVLPRERLAPRRIVVNIVAQCDCATAGASDNLADAIDYRKIQELVRDTAADSSFYLVEALAKRIADAVLSIEGISSTTVTVDKPGALEFCESVAIEITRRRRK